jgi:hypothetical protein
MRWLWIIPFLFSMNAQADYFCSSENQYGGIQYADAAGTVWEVLDLHFDETRILGGYLACTRFLREIPKEWNQAPRLLYLYPKSEQVARLAPGDPLIELCLKTPGCRLNPVFGLFRPIATIRSFMKPSLTRQMPECKEKTRRTEDEWNSQKPDSAIHPVSFDLGGVVSIPEQSLEESILHEIKTKNPKRILMSTMILSSHILGEVDRWMVSHPESEAWIFFSYNMQALESGFPENFQLQSKRIHLFPVFQTPTAEDSYHIKGMALEGADQSLWLYSVNLRRFREEKLVDRIFELKGKVPFDSFAEILDSVWTQQCRERRYSACTGELRFGIKSENGERIEHWLDESCAHPLQSKVASQPLLFRGGVSSIEDQIIGWIQGAKKEIRVSSHILNDSEISEELVRASRRGVEIEILVGTDSDGKWALHGNEHFKIYFRTRETGGIAHAKFMVFDRELAIWGTGNFTRTAMDNPWELFLATKEPPFLKMLADYFEKNRKLN